MKKITLFSYIKKYIPLIILSLILSVGIVALQLFIPYYIGKHSFKPKAFAQDMSLSAISEVLEKLAQYEDLAEQEEIDQQDDNS